MARKEENISEKDNEEELEKARRKLNKDDILTIKNFVELGGTPEEAFGDDLKIDEFGDRTLRIKIGKNRFEIPEEMFFREPTYKEYQSAIKGIRASSKNYVENNNVVQERVVDISENMEVSLKVICAVSDLDYKKAENLRASVIFDICQRFFTAFQINL